MLAVCLAGKAAPIHLDASDNRPAYEDFLAILSDEKYSAYPVCEYASSYRPDKINILLRHDADFDSGIGMVLLDLDHSIRSTTYLRVYGDEYKIEEVRDFYQKLERLGFEVGLHQEDVDRIFARDGIQNVVSRIRTDSSIPDKDKEILIETVRGARYDLTDEIRDELAKVLVTDDVIKLFKSDLELLHKYFDVRSVCEHGGTWNYLLERGPRWSVLSEESKVFSAYQIPFAKKMNFRYLSDVDSGFSVRKLGYFKEELGKLNPGDITEILIHPYIYRWQYNTYPSNYPIAIETKTVTETKTSSIIETARETRTVVETEIQTLAKTAPRTFPDDSGISLWIGLFSAPIALIASVLYILHIRKSKIKKAPKNDTG